MHCSKRPTGLTSFDRLVGARTWLGPLLAVVPDIGCELPVHNVTIVFHWAENKLDRLPALAADLVQRQVAVIVGPNIVMSAARAATSTLPIVFVSGGDPIATGLVSNLSRPGGNITGVSFASAPLQPKRLALLHELVPPPAAIAWLRDPRTPTFEMEEKEVPPAARELRRQLLVLNAQSERDQSFPSALEGLVANHGSPVAFHRRVMACDKLRRDHAFEFIPWLDAHQRIDRRMAFPPDFFRV